MEQIEGVKSLLEHFVQMHNERRKGIKCISLC